MRMRWIWCVCLAAAWSGWAGEGEPARLEVEVSGLRGTNGSLRVGLFRNEGFPVDESRAVTGTVVAVTGEVTVVSVGPVMPGEYAVLVYHDRNANGRMDYDWLGRPREGYGVSGGARRVWRSPRYEEAKVGIGPGLARIRVPVAY